LFYILSYSPAAVSIMWNEIEALWTEHVLIEIWNNKLINMRSFIAKRETRQNPDILSFYCQCSIEAQLHISGPYEVKPSFISTALPFSTWRYLVFITYLLTSRTRIHWKPIRSLWSDMVIFSETLTGVSEPVLFYWLSSPKRHR
jgi:hypothetical protein